MCFGRMFTVTLICLCLNIQYVFGFRPCRGEVRLGLANLVLFYTDPLFRPQVSLAKPDLQIGEDVAF